MTSWKITATLYRDGSQVDDYEGEGGLTRVAVHAIGWLRHLIALNRISPTTPGIREGELDAR